MVTPKGYTKHYYNGSQRIAAQIGRLENLPNDIIDTSAVATERIANACAYIQSLLSPDIELQPDTTATFVDIDGDMYDELQWQCTEEDLAWNIEMQCDSNILLPILSKDTSHLDNRVSGIYYYHPDHLGSATWITNSSGRAVQFIHYMPFGEMWYNQQGSAYNERYKFTGKERDEETGYDYFGARYYVPEIPIWLSVDPLADKYPNISPYAYCGWNPVKFVDPDGRGPNDRVILARELAEQQIPYNLDNGYYLRTATSPEALATMDCSEFVCRVMAGDGITSTIESHSTRDMLANMMSDETKFIKSDIPQAGDIVLWAGHTGIIEGYNEKDNTVTVLHATRYKKKDGTIVSSTRRENYSLNYYRGKNAFFYRPVNETPDVFEDSSTAKLQEIIVKPSKDDQNANY